MRIFLAGATGAIGRPLVHQLVERGHTVFGTTQTSSKTGDLQSLGATPVLLDGLDRDAVIRAIGAARPEVVIHQMTALNAKADFKHFDRWFALTNALRTRGTDNLLAGAVSAGVRLFIAQSYTGWDNIRAGGPVKTEDDPLDPHPVAWQAQTLAAFRYLHSTVLQAPLTGIVLRYGNLYGPGASEQMVQIVRRRMWPMVGNGTGVWSWLHVEDAARATVAALDCHVSRVFNIVDDEPAPASQWLPYLAEVVGAKPPLHVPAWLARFFIGEVGVQLMTEARAASNERAKRELNFHLAYPSWRVGFRTALTANESDGVAPRN